MGDESRRYFEQPEIWDRDYDEIPAVRDRTRAAVEHIPPDVRSVLDVGCGHGYFLRTLRRSRSDVHRLVGLDRSTEALRHVDGETHLGSIEALPFDDHTFDMVTALEVLEHVAEPDFSKALRELERASARYILVTVPNDQPLDTELVRCPRCGCWFHPYHHVRRFDRRTLENLFEGYTPKLIEGVGQEFGDFVTRTRLMALYRWLRKSEPAAGAMCPQCGWSQTARSGNGAGSRRAGSPARRVLEWLDRARKRRPWLLALYIRRTPE